MPRLSFGRQMNTYRPKSRKKLCQSSYPIDEQIFSELRKRPHFLANNSRSIGLGCISLSKQLNLTQYRRLFFALNLSPNFNARSLRLKSLRRLLYKSGFKFTYVAAEDALAAAKVERNCGLPFPPFIFSPKVNHETFNTNTKQGHLYLQLSKARLSTLVVVTSLGGYALCPASFQLTTFFGCVLGTYLTAFSANSINQCLETPFDAQMKRTQNRVLPRHALSISHAAAFGICSGIMGTIIFSTLTNSTSAILGLSNILLYTIIYTPMKRYSIYNTWIGSLVGAVPPIIGWTACCDSLEAGGFVLAAILFAWQFPHFNALSWNLRTDYSRAGYRMMAATRPDLLRRTALTYSVSLIPISSLVAPLSGLTSWSFAATSLPLNVYFSYLSFKFYKETDSKNSKKLFRCSLYYLPILMTLMLLSKPHVEKRRRQ
uniref:Protoheme IX farnesyltransferase, mitochondrial n=1 Tax=Romanomermis culicivorax TaxID=13658 RepID=A0A915I994_ROMCU